MRSLKSAKVFSSSGQLGTSTPARRAVAPLAKSQAICTWRPSGNMSGARRAAMQHGGIDLLGGGVGLGLVEHAAERAQDLRRTPAPRPDTSTATLAFSPLVRSWDGELAPLMCPNMARGGPERGARGLRSHPARGPGADRTPLRRLSREARKRPEHGRHRIRCADRPQGPHCFFRMGRGGEERRRRVAAVRLTGAM